MKFTVIGHFCVDISHNKNGSETKQYGGIYNVVSALANIASEKDTIIPVFGVGEREFYGVKDKLSRYSNVDCSAMYSYAGESNQMHLYAQGKQQTLCSKHIGAPIPFKKIEPYLNAHGVLINMESGSDISLETLDEIRLAIREKKTALHLDMHNLTLGTNPDYSRFPRQMSDWRRWCFMVNSIQLNENEAAHLAMETYDNEMLAKQMLPLMVNALCITRGANGVTVYQQEHKKLLTETIEGVAVKNVVDDSASGDIFGAAFFYNTCSSQNNVEAARLANAKAATSVSYSGEEKFLMLKEQEKAQ